MRIKRLAKLIHYGEDPTAETTIDSNTWEESHDTGTRRSGQPHKQWLTETMHGMWEITQEGEPATREDFNTMSMSHRIRMQTMGAQITIHMKTLTSIQLLTSKSNHKSTL